MKYGKIGAVLVLLACTGCSSKPVNEALVEHNYKMVYTYEGENNYYDTEGVCYTEWATKKDCRRVLEDNLNTITYEFVNETSDISAFVVNGVVEKIRHREIKDGKYTGNHYIYNVKGDYKTIENRVGDAKNWCEFSIENENPDIELKVCGEDTKDTYDQLYEKYNDMWDTMDISEKRLIKYVEEYTEENKDTLAKVVDDKLAAQKPFTAKEIDAKLKANYTFTKNAKDGFVLTSTDKRASLTGVKVNNKVQYYTYLFDTYSSDKSKYKMMYMYYPEMGKEIVSNQDASCMYNISDDTNIGDKECSKEQMKDGKGLRSGLNYMLKKMDLTKAEVMEFFEGTIK